MALINRPEGNKEISDKAFSCPYCGRSFFGKKLLNFLVRAAAAIGAVLAIWGIGYGVG